MKIPFFNLPALIKERDELSKDAQHWRTMFDDALEVARETIAANCKLQAENSRLQEKFHALEAKFIAYQREQNQHKQRSNKNDRQRKA